MVNFLLRCDEGGGDGCCGGHGRGDVDGVA